MWLSRKNNEATFQEFHGEEFVPPIHGTFFLVNEEPKSSGWNNASTITFEAPFGSNYPLKLNESPLKRDHFKRRLSSSNHQISANFRDVSFQRGNAKQNIQPYWCFFSNPDPPHGSRELFKGGAVKLRGVLNQKVGVFYTFTLLLCSALICLSKTSDPGKDDPILPTFFPFFSVNSEK